MKKTGRLLPETGRSQATNLETQKQTKWIEMHQSQVKDVFPKRSAEMKTQNSFEVCKTRSGIQRIMAISRDFCGYSKLMFLFFVLVSFYASWKFLLWLGSSAWDFLGDNFWSIDFLGFVWSSVYFFGFWFLPPFDPEYSLWAWVKLKRTLYFSHFPSQVNLYFSDWNQTLLKL